MTEQLTVTVAVPVFNERVRIADCLDAIELQTYPAIAEILVVDGESTDGTAELAASRADVRVIHNPKRLQAAALNLVLGEAKGEVIVRVDARSVVAPDYVASCVDALTETGAAIVGGAMVPVSDGWLGTGIAEAFRSPFGAGPARFHIGGRSRWTDTVYLGAFRTDLARDVGGYAEDMAVNEDAEFAVRMSERGGIWYDDRIQSSYVPRDNLVDLAKQFFSYGRGRAVTVTRHPGSVQWRQLAAPALVIGLCSPWRRRVALAYGSCLTVQVLFCAIRRPAAAPGMALAMPTMHISWGVGFLSRLLAASGWTGE